MGNLIIVNRKNDIHEIFFDDDDLAMLSKYKWHVVSAGKRFYAATNIWVEGHAHQKKLFMHRLLMTNDPNMMVDHIDLNGLNNCRENLRLTKPDGNTFNREFNKNATGYKGVFLDKRTGRYRVRIGLKYKNINIGMFSNSKDAAIAYNKAALKYHGKFANLNKL